MEYTDIRELAELMKELELTVLEISDRDTSVRLERGSSGAPAPAPVLAAEAPAAVPAPSQSAEAGLHTVTSPMIGVFYASPSPGSKAYVSVGDYVQTGDTLCVVEAMKIMNEITSEVSGVVAEICVSDKQIVEYGHPLFRIRPGQKAAEIEQ